MSSVSVSPWALLCSLRSPYVAVSPGLTGLFGAGGFGRPVCGVDGCVRPWATGPFGPPGFSGLTPLKYGANAEAIIPFIPMDSHQSTVKRFSSFGGLIGGGGGVGPIDGPDGRGRSPACISSSKLGGGQLGANGPVGHHAGCGGIKGSGFCGPLS